MTAKAATNVSNDVLVQSLKDRLSSATKACDAEQWAKALQHVLTAVAIEEEAARKREEHQSGGWKDRP